MVLTVPLRSLSDEHLASRRTQPSTQLSLRKDETRVPTDAELEAASRAVIQREDVLVSFVKHYQNLDSADRDHELYQASSSSCR